MTALVRAWQRRRLGWMHRMLALVAVLPVVATALVKVNAFYDYRRAFPGWWTRGGRLRGEPQVSGVLLLVDDRGVLVAPGMAAAGVVAGHPPNTSR
jgi:hypothetical protein